MSIKTFVSEFQDYLYNKLPLYDRVDVSKASKTDYYGVHKNAEELLEEYKESLEFLENNALDVDKELNTILASLEKKLDRIDLFANSIIGLNSTDLSGKSILSISPYILSNSPNWEQVQRTLVLPILSTYKTVYPYTTSTTSNKGISRFLLSDKESTKYISITKKHTSQINSIVCLNDTKDILSTKSVTNSLNKSNVLIEIPTMTRYVFIDYYFEDTESLSITPLTFKHTKSNSEVLPEVEVDYGSLLSFNASVETPDGCYIALELKCSFLDVNKKEVDFKNIIIPLGSDGYTVVASTKEFNGTVKGFWLEGHYSENNLDKIPKGAYIVYKPDQPEGVSIFTEATVKLDMKKAKTIKVAATLKLYSLYNNRLTPRINYLTGITKNV